MSCWSTLGMTLYLAPWMSSQVDSGVTSDPAKAGAAHVSSSSETTSITRPIAPLHEPAAMRTWSPLRTSARKAVPAPWTATLAPSRLTAHLASVPAPGLAMSCGRSTGTQSRPRAKYVTRSDGPPL